MRGRPSVAVLRSAQTDVRYATFRRPGMVAFPWSEPPKKNTPFSISKSLNNPALLLKIPPHIPSTLSSPHVDRLTGRYYMRI